MQLGMCPAGQWQKLYKDSLDWTVSTYEDNIFDVRMPLDPSRSIEVSTEEELLLHQLVSWVLGLIFMLKAEAISKSHRILQVMMILSRGVKLLPVGQRSSTSFFVSSAIVGAGALLFHYLSGSLRTFLVGTGISKDMHNSSAFGYILLIVCLRLARAWFRYSGLYSFVPTEGLMDTGVAVFVESAVLILSAVLFLQNSLDLLPAAVALSLAILISIRTRASTFLPHLFRRMIDIMLLRLASARQRASEDCCSTDGRTFKRKRFSEEEWNTFTKEQMEQSLVELFSALSLADRF